MLQIELLKMFLAQAETGNLKTSQYERIYNNLRVKVSFGMGTPAKVPWIVYLANGMDVQSGFSPAYLYYKELGILILAYGVGENHNGITSWLPSLISSHQTIGEYFKNPNIKYNDSHVFRSYKINILDSNFIIQSKESGIELTPNEIEDDFKILIKNYNDSISKGGFQNISFYKFSPQDLSIDGSIIDWMKESVIKLPINEKIGDLNNYITKDELIQKTGLKKERDDVWKYWNFKSAKIGDVIFLSEPVGRSGGVMTSLGIGIIKSEYYFDENENRQYKHKRGIEWIVDKIYNYKAYNILKYPEMFRTGVFSPTKIGPEILSEYLRVYPELEEVFHKYGLSVSPSKSIPINGLKSMSKPNNLNTILYGVPGTGKTYNTINYALSIIEEKSISEILNEDRKELNRRYNEYKEKGQIVFTTFHQSFGYEEFIEGLRANTDNNGNIEYSIEDGIFKKIAKKAEENRLSSTYPTQVRKDFHEVLDAVLMGISEENPKDIPMVQTSFKIYDYNDKTIFFEKALGGRNHSLSMKTLERMYNTRSEDIIKGGLNVYYIPLRNLLFDKENSLKMELNNNEVTVEKTKNYVLIIDEINRGNISKIFGELITLIEDSKRIGNLEATTVILPNSQEEFGVPNNLFLLGTMNTADRSIALMDIALRRRFTFKEIKPDSTLLENIRVGNIEIQKMFDTLNKRIEYLFDRDHILGHSFFLPLSDDPTLERLNQIFKDSIIPLLQEYFYEDWGKIQIIFGDHKEQGFKNVSDRIIYSEETSEIEVLGFNHDDIIDEKSTFSINDNPTENSYIGIYQTIHE